MLFMRPATNVTLTTRQYSFHMAIPTAFKTYFYATFPRDYLVLMSPQYPGFNNVEESKKYGSWFGRRGELWIA